MRSPLTAPQDQKLAVLSLHLLQACLVYINTLMIQQVLDDPTSGIALAPDDLRGLTPLIYSHVNPYGTFRLDMIKRLPLASCVKTSTLRLTAASVTKGQNGQSTHKARARGGRFSGTVRHGSGSGNSFKSVELTPKNR